MYFIEVDTVFSPAGNAIRFQITAGIVNGFKRNRVERNRISNRSDLYANAC